MWQNRPVRNTFLATFSNRTEIGAGVSALNYMTHEAELNCYLMKLNSSYNMLYDIFNNLNHVEGLSCTKLRRMTHG